MLLLVGAGSSPFASALPLRRLPPQRFQVACVKLQARLLVYAVQPSIPPLHIRFHCAAAHGLRDTQLPQLPGHISQAGTAMRQFWQPAHTLAAMAAVVDSEREATTACWHTLPGRAGTACALLMLQCAV